MTVLGVDNVDHSGFVTFCTMDAGEGDGTFGRVSEEDIRLRVNAGEMTHDTRFKQAAAYRSDFTYG